MGLVHRFVLPCLIGGTLGMATLGCGGSHSTIPPTIASISPQQAPAGNNLYITGSGFTGTTAVSLGTQACAFFVNNDSAITALIPAAGQSGAVTVSSPGGTSTYSTEFFIVPVITSLSATTMKAGDTVTINGSGFYGAISPLVVFGPPGAGTPGSTNQTVFAVTSANQITTTVPSGVLAGSGYIFTITVPGPNGGFISNNPSGTSPNPTFTIQ